MVRNALFCLETAAAERENHVYTKALMAYAFALAGKEDKRKALLGSLEKEAVKKGECSRWDVPFFHLAGLTSSLDKMERESEHTGHFGGHSISPESSRKSPNDSEALW